MTAIGTLSPDQQAAIVQKAKEHARKNRDFLKSTFPGIALLPTDGRTVKVSVPLPDGNYITVFRGKDMLLDDRQTSEFVASAAQTFNEAWARQLRYTALDEVLLEA